MASFQATRRIKLGGEWFESGDRIPESLGRDWALLSRRGMVVEIQDGRQSKRNAAPEPPDPGKLSRSELEERAEEAGVGEPDAAPNKEALAEQISERERLGELHRAELDKRAADLGVESPEKLPNKGAVIDALLDAQSE